MNLPLWGFIIALVASLYYAVQYGRKLGYQSGFADGRVAGIFLASKGKWECGCGNKNPAHTVMCARCGSDRLPPFASEVHSPEESLLDRTFSGHSF